MVGLLHDIPAITFFIALVILVLLGIALQARVHHRDLSDEDNQFVRRLAIRGVAGLLVIWLLIKIISLLAK